MKKKNTAYIRRHGTVIRLLLLYILGSITATRAFTQLRCCEGRYDYQNTSNLPEYTYASEIRYGTSIIPNAPVGPVTIPNGQFKYFEAANLIQVDPGNTLNAGLYTVTGFCDERKARNNTPKIDIFLFPNVFTPNGDGVNDYFSVNVNSASYYSMKIYQRIRGYMREIVSQEDYITGNWVVLWDGIKGVKSGSSNNTTSFFISIWFLNCREKSHTWGWVSVFNGQKKTAPPDSVNLEFSDLYTSGLNSPLAEQDSLKAEDNKTFRGTNLTVYPNPARNSFLLSSAQKFGNSAIRLIDIFGKEQKIVIVNVDSYTKTIRWNSLPKGIYTAIISSGKTTEAVKVMIE